MKTIDGATIDLGDLYGKKAVYLKFWATWRVPCRQQMPHFEHAFETAGADLAVIAIDVGFNDSLDAIRRYPGQSVSLLEGRSFPFQEPGAQRPTVFVFLSPWCESYLATTRPAVAESCRRVREQVSALAGDGRVRWLGVASGLWAKREDLRRYRKDYKVTIPLTLDASGGLFREFRVNEVPTVIVADTHGNIVRRVEPSDAQGLKKALDTLL